MSIDFYCYCSKNELPYLVVLSLKRASAEPRIQYSYFIISLLSLGQMSLQLSLVCDGDDNMLRLGFVSK